MSESTELLCLAFFRRIDNYGRANELLKLNESTAGNGFYIAINHDNSALYVSGVCLYVCVCVFKQMQNDEVSSFCFENTVYCYAGLPVYF